MQDFIKTPVGNVPRISTCLSSADHMGTTRVRLGFLRSGYRVVPGVYAVGDPAADSPVLVTANYKLSFDMLRKELGGVDAWLLVIDTRGINVWCAAGKGLFSTEEVVAKVRTVGLEKLVSHRKLILPQLAAPGVAGHSVKKQSGFEVAYGPVRAADLKEYLLNGMKCSASMREVTFSLRERAELVPVEVVLAWKWIVCGMLVFLLLGGIGPWGYALAEAWQRGWAAFLTSLLGFLGGAVLAPILLPYIPARMFWVKGAAVGGVMAVLTGLVVSSGVGPMLLGTAMGSYMMMNFTGSTPYTSPSGVEYEMRRGIPVQLAAAVLGMILWLAAPFLAGGL